MSHAAVLARAVSDAIVGQPDWQAAVAAAWLHGIGSGLRLVDTGCIPVDGARFLARGGWPDPVVALVAHHRHPALTTPDVHRLKEFPAAPQPAAAVLLAAEEAVAAIQSPAQMATTAPLPRQRSPRDRRMFTSRYRRGPGALHRAP